MASRWGHTTILPLWRELRLAVPFHRLFPHFLGHRYPVFLDSSLTHPEMGRFSYIASDPVAVIRSKNGRVVVAGVEGAGTPSGDPFAVLSDLLARFPAETLPGIPPFQGGAVGYFGYDLVHHVENLPRTVVDDLDIPDMVVGVYDRVLSHEHASGRTWALATPIGPHGQALALARLDDLAGAAEDAAGEEDSRVMPALPPSVESNFSRERYLDCVRRAREYIAAGDIYQVNLSQRLRAPLGTTSWDLYRSLRRVSPVPYGAYLGLGDFDVVSASPELFLRKDGMRVETRPIKGTRPRGRTLEEDRRLAYDLLASEKDRAENVMIVDLLRNDIGRVCETGSVKVPNLYSLESYATVHHLVSTVVGTLGVGHDAVSLLKACFPGGSITGCPKIRSMEIIDELEPTQRGVYCGSIGFIGFDGSLDTSIAIRTVVVKEGWAYFQVGGAIVADSDPEAEYQETLDKARAVLLALGGSYS